MNKTSLHDLALCIIIIIIIETGSTLQIYSQSGYTLTKLIKAKSQAIYIYTHTHTLQEKHSRSRYKNTIYYNKEINFFSLKKKTKSL